MDNWERLSRLSLKELKELQNKKLRHFISRKLYPFSPYYRRLFDRHKIKARHIKTVEDLKIIPFTQKENFFSGKGFLDFILQPDKTLIKKYSGIEKEYRSIFLTATTGTTSNPVSFLYTDFDLKNLCMYGYRLFEIFNVGGDIRGVNLFPYAPHLAFWQTVFAGISHNNFLLSTGGGKVMGTPGNIEMISRVKPAVLIGVPSYVYHLVRSARESGKNFSFVQKIILGASRVPAGFKEKLASLLKEIGAKHVRIMGTYGFTEAKCAWGECPTPLNISSGYHIYPDKEVFEIIDPESGEVKKEGESGEIVYTAIDARGSCVLRYRTGDLVKGGIVYKRCPYCKRTVPRISSDISRLSHIKDLMLSKVKGTLVNLNDIFSILEAEKGIEEWQIEIRKKDNDPYEVDELIIYLSPVRAIDRELLKKRLKSKIQTATEIMPNEIVILSHKEMLDRIEMESSHKEKRLIDNRNLS